MDYLLKTTLGSVRQLLYLFILYRCLYFRLHQTYPYKIKIYHRNILNSTRINLSIKRTRVKSLIIYFQSKIIIVTPKGNTAADRLNIINIAIHTYDCVYLWAYHPITFIILALKPFYSTSISIVYLGHPIPSLPSHLAQTSHPRNIWRTSHIYKINRYPYVLYYISTHTAPLLPIIIPYNWHTSLYTPPTTINNSYKPTNIHFPYISTQTLPRSF